MKKFLNLLAVFVASGALAQTDSATNILNEVVVTATKSPKKISETGKVVTIITRDQIEKSGGKDFSQLLTEQTGIMVNGAVSNPGKDKSLYLRGATDKYTLILLDGIPLNEPAGVGGSFDLRLLSLDNIERIEIVKGSQSTLYGSNAVAGVINLISKKPVSSKPAVQGMLTYGSFNSKKAMANLSQQSKWIDYDLNYTYYATDGISEAKDTTGTAGYDKDGFNRHAIQALVGIKLNERMKIAPYYRYSRFDGDYDADAFADAGNAYTASLLNTGFDGHMNYTGGSLHVNYGYDFTTRNYASSFGVFATSGRFHHGEAYVQQSLAKQLKMIAGINYQSYSIQNPDTSNNMISPYASLFFNSGTGWNIELGGRFNHHNQYGNNITYSFNPSYMINERVKLFVNFSSGFRAPSINELFGPFGGNASLKPEQSATQEAGVQANLVGKKLAVTVTGFNRTIKDVIIYGPQFTYENRDKQHDFGAELELSYMPAGNLTLKASYAYIDGEITQSIGGKDTSFYNLVRRPKHTVNGYVGWQVTTKLMVSTSVQLIGERTDTYYDPQTYIPSEVVLKGYAMWNAYVSYQLAQNRLHFFADAKNLLNNTGFYEVYGYSVPGINITCGLRFTL